MLCFSSVLIKFIQLFAIVWNEFLDKLKFSMIKLCQAKNVDSFTGKFIKPCEKYTHGKYCEEHLKQLAHACKEYHYTRGICHNDPMLHVWAKKELNARIVYCQRFSIRCDYGHLKWNNHLQDIIKGYEQRVLFREENKKNRLARVLNTAVQPQELKNYAMNLEPANKYEQFDNIDDDWSDSGKVDQRDQLNKININTFLFNNYFKRSSDNDVKYLNLIKAIKREKKLNYFDNEDW